jgi:hypothetical protein
VVLRSGRSIVAVAAVERIVVAVRAQHMHFAAEGYIVIGVDLIQVPIMADNASAPRIVVAEGTIVAVMHPSPDMAAPAPANRRAWVVDTPEQKN